jgi:hypothetical protein
MTAHPNGGAHMLAKWERAYLGMLYVLLAVAATLFFWGTMINSTWRTRSAFVFIIGWVIAVRLGAKWVPSKWAASVNRWLARGRLYAFCFNLLWNGFPLGVFGYLARWQPRWELLTLILTTSLIPLLFLGKTDTKVRPEV